MGPIVCLVQRGVLVSEVAYVYSGALFSGHQWDLSYCLVQRGVLTSGVAYVYSGALFSGHQ